MSNGLLKSSWAGFYIVYGTGCDPVLSPEKVYRANELSIKLNLNNYSNSLSLIIDVIDPEYCIASLEQVLIFKYLRLTDP